VLKCTSTVAHGDDSEREGQRRADEVDDDGAEHGACDRLLLTAMSLLGPRLLDARCRRLDGRLREHLRA